MKSFNCVEQLSPTRENWKIKVRVTRIWDAVNAKNNNDLLSLDLILLDEHGQHIHASIWKTLVPKFRPLLLEGRVYLVSFFKVVQSKGYYRPVDQTYKINFTTATTVKEIEEGSENIQLHKFELVKFEDIPLRYGSNIFLIDVVGRIVAATKIEEVQSTNSVLKRRNIELLDNSNNKMHITLWAGCALKFDEEIAFNSGSVTVLIITSTIVKQYNGQTYLSSSSATKIYTNLQIPEVAEIIESATSEDCQVRELQSPTKKELQIDDLIFKKRLNISELLKISSVHDNEGSMYSIKATIMKIETNFGWFYISCPKHRNKLIQNETTFWCDQCGGEVQYPQPRYKLQTEVADHSGSTTVVMFDKIAEKIIGQPVQMLIQGSTENTGHEEAIEILEKLIGSTFIFLTRLNSYNTTRGRQNYTATKILPLEYPLESQRILHIIQQGPSEPTVELTQQDKSSYSRSATPSKDTEYEGMNKKLRIE